MSVRVRFLSVRGALLLALLLVVHVPCLAQPSTGGTDPTTQLEQVITDTVDAEAFNGAIWGVHVVNLRTGEVLHTRNGRKSFVPASNVKLLTAAAALERLGPGYRYTTSVYAEGPIRDGVLHGNLIVRGDGDPTIGGYRQREDPTRVFRQWTDSLRAHGISRVGGAVVGDDARFHGPSLGEGWSWTDLTHGYGASTSGLVFNENAVDLELRGRQAGEPAEIRWTPVNTDYVTVVNRSRTVARSVDDEEEYQRALGTNTIHVRSRVHPGAVEDASIAVRDPTLYFADTFRTILLKQGLPVDGAATVLNAMSLDPGAENRRFRRVATYTSPPLSRIIQTLNRESRNVYAEQLLRTLVVEASTDTNDIRRAASPPDGTDLVKESLAHASVDTSKIQLADGSGLSRQNLASPAALVRVLQHMWHHKNPELRSAFLESLPQGGADGTLEYRFQEQNAAGTDVRAKTGTLSNVSSLSGYVTSARGMPLAFSILCNHHHADDDQVRSAQDAIVSALAQLPL